MDKAPWSKPELVSLSGVGLATNGQWNANQEGSFWIFSWGPQSG